MLFPQQTPWSYTRADIERLTLDQMGVYGIYRENRWVYVGSGDMRTRLLAHVSGDNLCIKREQPTHWVGEVTSDYVRRGRELILEMDPACNQRVG